MKIPAIIAALILLLVPQQSSANGPTYVDSCGVTSSADYETLIITNDISAVLATYCILITHQHVTVDCQGHLLSGAYPDGGLYQGIRITDAGDYATVKNCRLSGFFLPIYLLADHGLIENNEVADCGFGIALGDSIDSAVIDNTLLRNSWTGIVLEWSHGNLIEDNTLVDSGAILIQQSDLNNVINNRCFDGGIGISVNESRWNNIVDNRTTLNHVAGIGLMDAEENFVSDNKTTENGYGIWESGSDLNNIYDDNNCKNNTVDSNVPDACN